MTSERKIDKFRIPSIVWQHVETHHLHMVTSDSLSSECGRLGSISPPKKSFISLAPSLFLHPVTVKPTMTKCMKLSFTVSDFFWILSLSSWCRTSRVCGALRIQSHIKQRKTRGWSRELTSGQWLLIPQLQGLEDQRREAIICLCQLELQVSRGGKHAGRLARA